MPHEILVNENTGRLVEAWELMHQKPRGSGLGQMLEIAMTLVQDQQQGYDIFTRVMDGSRASQALSGCGPASALAKMLLRQNDKEGQFTARISDQSKATLGKIGEHLSTLGYAPKSDADLLGAAVTYVFDLKLDLAGNGRRLEIRKGQETPQPRLIEGLNW